jgi:hypothetical protein
MLYAFALGAALGVFYDVLRIFRLLLGLRPNAKETPRVKLPLVGAVGRPGRGGGFFAAAVTFVCDVLFFAVATAVYNVLVFHAANGQNRWFFTLAAIAGFAVYLLTVGRLTVRASGLIRFALSALFAYVFFFLSLPFRAARSFIVLPLASKLSCKLAEKRTKNARKALAKTIGMVYNIK